MGKTIFTGCKPIATSILNMGGKATLLGAMLFPIAAQSGAGETMAKVVKGRVVSVADNEPLIGVSVTVKGTGKGTVTDIDGNYSIDVNDGQTLVFSYVGFLPQNVRVSGSNNYSVTLSEDSQSLDDVVVIGYGVQKKKLVTGATTQMKGDDVARLNTTSPLQAMQGQTPGVSIQSTSGQPGADMKVVIRGLGTVGSSGPLYLIDGVGGDISTVNPADIESIDVLKDAASAAIYGAQAANGVVLVTTKHGSEGRAKVSFDGYVGWQKVARKAALLNSEQYRAIMDEASVNSGNGAVDWSKYSTITDADGNYLDTDWMGRMFKDNAQTKSYNIGVTGGSAASTYAISWGYIDQEGVIGGKDVSNYERYNFRVNADQKLYKWLKVGEQIGLVYKKTRGISVGDQYNNSLRGAFAAVPLIPVEGANKYDSPYYDTSNSDYWKEQGNPYGRMMDTNHSENRGVNLIGNAYAELTPLKGLTFRTQLGTTYSTSEYRGFRPHYYYSPYDPDQPTQASQSMGHGFGMTFTNTLDYKWTMGEHAFNALAGMESYRYEGTSLYAANAILKDGYDNWDHAYVTNGTASSADEGLQASGAPHDESRSVSYFGRIGWDWKETYMVNATLRADGSSRFASGHRFGYFPSVSGGWVVSNEAFMRPLSRVLDFLKLRASWGQVGNQNIDNYQYLSPIKITNTHYNFGTGMGASAQSQNWGAYPSRLSNPDLTWETSEQTNIGFDARLLGSRLGVNFDYYWKTTKDWLVQAPVLATAGTGAPIINGGDVKNHGMELNVTWNDRIGKDFSYQVGANMAYNHNEVGNIPTEDGIIHGRANMLYDNSEEFYRAENGHAIGYFWGYKTAGIFQNQQEIDEWIAAGNGVLQGNVKPGDVKYYDLDHNGVINEKDKTDLGNGMPKVTFGFNLSMTYKGFDLSLTANGAAGHKLVQSYRNHANSKANYTQAILSRWTGEGTSDFMPRVTETNVNWQFSDLYLQDGDYLRLSNVTVGYDFSRLMQLKWVSQARLYFQVQNLATFTKYDGMDPEIGYGTDAWVSGVDVGYYPRPRTYLFGVNLKF